MGQARRPRLVRRLVVAGVALAAIAAALGTAHAASSPDGDQTRIVGGVRAQQGEFPWMVRLSMGCGGALFTTQIVLTAAHCVEDRGTGPDTSITATAGVVDLQSGERIQVRSTFIHVADDLIFEETPTRFSLVNDWALIKLARPIDLPTLPIATDTSLNRGRFQVMGWGASTEDGAQKRFLRKASVPSVTDTTCRTNYTAAGFTYVDRAMLCAGFLSQRIDSCQGDSGGPLVNRAANGEFVQVGIVSFGFGCAREDFPGVYTQVSTFAADIRAAAEALP
jgi:secreted trypsin-like serine protease